MAGERLKERMARLETLLGDWPEDEDTVTAFADSMKNEFEVQRNLMEASDKYAGERIDALKTDLQALMAEYQDAVQSMGVEISILKKAVDQSPSLKQSDVNCIGQYNLFCKRPQYANNCIEQPGWVLCAPDSVFDPVLDSVQFLSHCLNTVHRV